MKQYLFIDTNIFFQYKFKYKTSLLSSLSSLDDDDLLVSLDIARRESAKKNAEHIKGIKDKLEGALNKASDFGGDHLNGVSNEIKGFLENDSFELALQLEDEFWSCCKKIEIEADDLVSISEIADGYFKLTPPFSPKKNKEFIDAIALKSIKNWSDKNDHKVFVVSKDPDWHRFCESQDNLNLFDKLSDALQEIERKRKEFDGEIPSNVIETFKVGLETKLDDERFKSDIRIHVEEELLSSPFNAVCNFWGDFSSEIEGVNVFDFRVILDDIDLLVSNKKYLVFQVPLSVKVHVDAHFFFHKDTNYFFHKDDSAALPFEHEMTGKDFIIDIDSFFTFDKSTSVISEDISIDPESLPEELVFEDFITLNKWH